MFKWNRSHGVNSHTGKLSFLIADGTFVGMFGLESQKGFTIANCYRNAENTMQHLVKLSINPKFALILGEESKFLKFLQNMKCFLQFVRPVYFIGWTFFFCQPVNV